MIDQFVIGFKPQRWWGSLAAVDFFLGGTGAGAFVLSMSLNTLPGMIVGWVAVALGAVALLADLGKPGRFVRAGSQAGRSWISRGAIFTSIFLLFGILRIAAQVAPGLPWAPGGALGQAVGLLATLGALGVMVYTGFLLSQSPSIPFWNTTMLPLLFASFAFTCGVGVVLVMLPILGEKVIDLRTVELLSMALVAASLVLLWAYMLSMSSSTVAAKESVRMLTSGPLASLFWLGVNVVGLIVPLVAIALVYVSNAASGSTLALALAGILVLVGGYISRYCVLKAGVYPPVIDL
ncbi:MAG: DmsC/YnfH family molybdoenzyme membrane anchor subunit [Dehalococcoidia bacterium]|nr:DmsC/YnfH family molybdoenzyme membrane anchor subunit [Dehalococcoidia bacterium]